jgi:hypothetical protein
VYGFSTLVDAKKKVVLKSVEPLWIFPKSLHIQEHGANVVPLSS